MTEEAKRLGVSIDCLMYSLVSEGLDFSGCGGSVDEFGKKFAAMKLSVLWS